MKRFRIFVFRLLLLGVLLSSCGADESKNEAPVQEAEVDVEQGEGVEHVQPEESVAVEEDVEETVEPVIPAAPTDEELAEYSDYYRNHLTRLRDSWGGLESPVVMIYDGYEFGDYQHIVFVDEQEMIYDFGDGANDYGEIDEGKLLWEESPYRGKSFEIHWEWKKANFYCCEGMMENLEAKVPSITKLVLLEEVAE